MFRIVDKPLPLLSFQLLLHDPSTSNPPLAAPTGRRRYLRSFLRTALGSVLLVGPICFALTHASPSVAETISIIGADGANGMQGSTGIPGANGTSGAAGESVEISILTPGEDHSATARGGRGGNGGRGGDARVGSGADGGDGGDGRDGGSATVDVTTTDANGLTASATGGRGAAVGQGGDGSSPGLDGAAGSYSGSGGSATATGRLIHVNSTDPNLDGLSRATAGHGASVGGSGGDARATIEGEAAGGQDGSHNLTARALGGEYGSDSEQIVPRGGDAVAEAVGRTDAGSLAVDATAWGGQPPLYSTGVRTGRGGEATANASGVHTGAGSLEVRASAIGAADTEAKAFGSATGGADVLVESSATTQGDGTSSLVSHAEGISTGGGDVEVIVRANREDALGTAGTIELHNAARGETSGKLTLRQLASSRNGDVAISLVAENENGGDLELGVGATTFTRSGALSIAEKNAEVILGDVVGHSQAGADVEVSVYVGGLIRRESQDDPSQTSRILGTSAGGDVSVSADFNLYDVDRTTTSADQVIGADGVDNTMENVVDGTTTGGLRLIQNARGGDGTPVALLFCCPQPIEFSAEAGRGGDAINRIRRTGDYRSLTLRGTSRGGEGGHMNGTSLGTSGRGGEALTELDGHNDAGGVTLFGEARGGAGGVSSAAVERGGDAVSLLTATTTGDGHDIQIGGTGAFGIVSRGGPGGEIASAFGASGGGPEVVVGRGGHAESRSEGRAMGDSRVIVSDHARAGTGGRGSFAPFAPPPNAIGGQGGSASSEAIAVTAGESLAQAQSEANGGRGGSWLTTGGDGGNAYASSLASGLGQVDASAAANGGGINSDGALAGSASAQAVANGSSGLARAEASTGLGSPTNLRALAQRDVLGSTRVDATTSFREGLPVLAPQPSSASGSAFLTGQPLADDVTRIAADHAVVESILTERPQSRVGAVGQWHAANLSSEVSTQFTELDITLDRQSPGDSLQLAVFEMESIGGGFEELIFRLEAGGESFGTEQRFDDPESAAAFFATAFLLGSVFTDSLPSGTPSVRAIFEVRSGLGQTISYGLAAVVVPEPTTGLLVLVGLVVLATQHTSGKPNFHALCRGDDRFKRS